MTRIEKGTKTKGRGGARRNAGRKRIYPEGTIKAWVKARPDTAKALGVTTARELRDKLMAMMNSAPPSPNERGTEG